MRCRIFLCAALMLLGGFAESARADEIQYLPDGCSAVYSVDMAGFLKSKLFQEAKTKIKGFDDAMKQLGEEMGIPAVNMARVTFGVASDEKRVEGRMFVVTALKPITAAEVKANRKPRSYQKKFTHNEVKVGAHTVYQESYIFEFDKEGKTASGKAFCVVEKHLIIYAERLEVLAKVLERNKKPMLSAGMESRLKEAGLKSTLTLVMDVTRVPEREKKLMLRDLGKQLPGLENVLEGLRTLTVQGDATGQVKLSATMHCKDAATADDFRKVADAGVVLAKGLLKDQEGRDLPPEAKEAMQGLGKALDAIKLSTKGAQVNAEVAIDAATAVMVMQGMFVTKKAEKKEVKEFKDGK